MINLLRHITDPGNRSQAAEPQPGTRNEEPGTPRLTERQLVWRKVIRGNGVPLAVAKRVFGQDPKPIIEELNEVLVA